MRLAVAQIDTSGLVPGDAARRLLETAQIARDGGARLMLCPYATLSYPISPDAADQIDYAIELTEAVARITRDTACPLILCGGIDMSGFTSDMALYIHDGVAEPVAVGMRSKNAGASTVTIDGVKLAIACTYDDIDDLADAKTGADVVVFASAHSFAAADSLSAMGAGFSEGYLSEFAQDLDSWLVGAASLGGYGEDIYCGASFVITPWGELAAHAPAFEEHLLMYDLDPRTEGPLDSPSEPDFFDRSLMMWMALSLGMSDLLRAQGMSDVAVALDGGLTSSLVCVLASDALGPTHVHALLPCTLDDAGAARAKELGDALGVIQHAPDATYLRLAKDENGVALITQLELARLADALDALPLAALDKTALALEADVLPLRVGWFAPLGDVYRLDLAELARLRNTISPVVPRECIRELVVPEVEGVAEVAQTPRARLEFVDMVLMSRIEGGRTPSELAHSYGHAEAIDAITKRFCDAAPSRRGYMVLRASPHTATDTHQPLGLTWRNRVHEEPMAGRIDAIMAKVAASGVQVGVEQQVGEMLNLLHDLSGTQAAGMQRPNPLGWGIPFSEN